MIQGYQPPELLIRQNLQNIDTTERERLSALIIGPQYTWPDPEVDTVLKEAVDSDPITYTLSFTNADGDVVSAAPAEGWEVVSDSIKVYLENAEVPLNSGALAATTTTSDPSVIRFAGPVKGGTILAAFDSREVQLGDLVYVTETDTSRTAKLKVAGFVGELTEPDYEIDNLTTNPITNANSGVEVWSQSAKIESISGGTQSADAATVVYYAPFLTAGYKYIDTDGNIRAGVKATIKVLTFNGTNAGTARVSYEDGLISAATIDYTWATGILSIASQVGVELLCYDNIDLEISYVSGETPAFGDTVVVTVDVPYERLSASQLAVTDTFPDSPADDNKYYIRVKTGTAITGSGSYTYADAVVTVYDQNGDLAATDVTVPYATGATIPIGDTNMSLVISALNTLDQTGLRKGDVYVIDYVAAKASTTVFDGVIVNGVAAIGNATSQTLSVKFRKSADGEITAEDFASATLPVTVDAEAGTLTLASTASWTKSEPEFAVNKYPTIVAKGDAAVGETPLVYAGWQAFKIPAASEGIIQLNSAADLAQLGEVHPDNDLAFGAYVAMQAAPDKSIYAIRTAGPSKEAFEAALAKVERQDYVYALAPMTSDKAIGKVIATHCEDMSADDVKNFRRAYFGVDSPGAYIVADEDSNGNPYTATITAYTGGNRRVQFQQTIDLNALGVIAGDYIVVEGATYAVASVSPSGQELIIKTGPAFPYTSPVETVVWRADTADSQASYVENVAKFIASRRCPVVWTEGGVAYKSDGTSFVTPVKYVAAYIAGKRSSTLPWLGLSRSTVDFLISAAPMYLKYSRTLLNRVASNGVFIVTQAVEEGPVYVRHQLTSNVSEGSLAYEDSIGVNLDDLSFQVKDSFEPLIGVTNVTSETLRIAEQRIQSTLVDAKTSETDPLIGPQLIEFFDEKGEPGRVTVVAHPTFKDRMVLKAQVEVPLPNNTTIVELTAVSGISL